MFEDDEEDTGVGGEAGKGLCGSWGDDAVDFLLFPMFNWLKLRGNRAKKFGAVVVVGVAVTFALDDVIMFMSGDDEAWNRFFSNKHGMWLWLWFDGIFDDNERENRELLSFFVA